MKGNNYKDSYYQKINSHYNFEIRDQKFQNVQRLTRFQTIKFFRNAILFGILTETLIVNTSIYENVIRKTTIHRLESKRKEDNNLKERKLLNQQNIQKQQQ